MDKNMKTSSYTKALRKQKDIFHSFIDDFLFRFILIVFILFFVWRTYLLSSYQDTIKYLRYVLLVNTPHNHNIYPSLLQKSPFPQKTKSINLEDPSSSSSAAAAATAIVSSPSYLDEWIKQDPRGRSNMTWDYMMGVLGVKSFLDIGCGNGYSTNYFYQKGARVLCIEASSEAILQSYLPSTNLIVEHDYTQGPYWPDSTYDACWVVEFLEHVSRQYFKNYINSFRKCALIFVTVAPIGGPHHVEVHSQSWWIGRFTSAGFTYFELLTTMIRKLPSMEKRLLRETFIISERVEKIVRVYGMYIEQRMLVFVNPAIASLPEHDHLFAGDGCVPVGSGYNAINIPCKDFEPLPKDYHSLLRCTKNQEKRAKLKLSVENMYWECFPYRQ